MLSEEIRCIYRANQLVDVICQLRFPEILTIEANAPVEFQEAVRGAFPKFSVRKEHSSPMVSGTPSNLHLEAPISTNNYQFTSADGSLRINLTSKFISLSCNRYTRWEDFAKQLDLPLAAFIQIYHPALFERIGLRYINAISRRDLGLEDCMFRDLIQPIYLGPLNDENISESAFHRVGTDFEVMMGGGITAKVHAGPGHLNKNGQTDPEPKFILDLDHYVGGDTMVCHAAPTLDAIHCKATQMFRGSITDTLHNAMDPITA